jgi:hypothetical protein
MPKAEQATDELIALRKRAERYGLRLRRRDVGYSLYGNSMELGNGLRRVDFLTPRQIARWLNKWAKDQLAQLSRSNGRR